MSEESENAVVLEAKAKGSAKMANIVYILYLAAVIFPMANIIGVIMAYVNKGDSPAWVQSHYQFLIRTFWITFLIGIIGGITSAFGIGLLILIALVIWYLIRAIKGMKMLSQDQAIPDPTTWKW